jgi:ABC-type multidrug transport system ATPase subunit
MRQRFGIAQLLLNKPQLIIVDEPTAGLDPAERNRFLNVLRDIGSENIVIFSTHLVEDVRELCTQLAIMDQGRILRQTSPVEAIKALEGKIWVLQTDKAGLSQLEQEQTVLSSSFNEDHSLKVRVFASHLPNEHFQAADPTLEDVYFTALKNHA